jgi:phosphoenolpyruvate phosphomutase
VAVHGAVDVDPAWRDFRQQPVNLTTGNLVSYAGSLRQLLGSGLVVRAVGAHDGFTALLAQRFGFEAIWAGGLGISTAHGVPDAGLLTMSEFHAAAVQMRRCTNLPIIADVDAGFGDANVIQRMVRLYETSGIDAVCIEDKQYPKRNSFRNGHVLEDAHVFAGKIAAARAATSGHDFMIVARLESLIAGRGMADALSRAEAYCAAGADALLIHSRSRQPDEIAEFIATIRAAGNAIPIFVVPTTYHVASAAQLHALGANAVIYANQVMRAAMRAIAELLETVSTSGSTTAMESRIATVTELFDLVETNKLLDDEPWAGLADEGLMAATAAG